MMFDKYEDDWIDEFGVISCNDCTGLIPVLPQSEYEWESYQTLSSTELNGSGFINPLKGNHLCSDRQSDPNP